MDKADPTITFLVSFTKSLVVVIAQDRMFLPMPQGIHTLWADGGFMY